MRSFSQVDVFSSEPLLGNPVAVVHGADGISDEEMAAFARWTNLSETTFLLEPTDERADYRLRIFTPGLELPFAGHPTLGSAHAWLEAGGSRSRGRARPGVRRGAGAAAAGEQAGVRGAAPGAGRGRWVTRTGRGSSGHSASATTRSSTWPGPTTGRGGWRCCSRARSGCSPCSRTSSRWVTSTSA